MNGYNTIGEMTRGDAYYLICKIYAGKKILVHRYDLYEILHNHYVSEGGMKSHLNQKQIYNFMGDVVKALKRDPEIHFESSRTAGTNNKGALYLLDLRDSYLWNDDSSPIPVTYDENQFDAEINELTPRISTKHIKKSSKPSTALNDNNSIFICNDAVIQTPVANGKIGSVFFYSYPMYIESPDSEGRYIIAIGTTESESPKTALDKSLGIASLEWPHIIKIIYCSSPEKLKMLFKDYFHNRSISSPGKNCFNISPEEITNAYNEIVNRLLVEYGI